MYLKSTAGKILFEGRFSSLKKGVEMAVEAGVVLAKIDLRYANLMGAQMDGAIMPEACLWGANLNNSNMSAGDFTGADFRTANFVDTCLAESCCSGTDFSGAYFSRAIFRQTDLSGARFSCPSIFSIDLVEARTLENAVYSHMGEVDCDLSHAPLIIKGLPQTLIFMDDTVLVGTKCLKIPMRENILQSLLQPIENIKIMESERLDG